MYATLVEHHRKFPEVEVHTVDGDHDQLLHALANNAVDIAIMTSTRSAGMLAHSLFGASGSSLRRTKAISWLERRLCIGQTLRAKISLCLTTVPARNLNGCLSSKLNNCGPQRLLHQESALDRLLSMVSADIGILLMLEGATGVRFDGVVYREVHDVDGPTRLNFAGYRREGNPGSYAGTIHRDAASALSRFIGLSSR